MDWMAVITGAWAAGATLYGVLATARVTRHKTSVDAQVALNAQQMQRLAQVEARMASYESELAKEREAKLTVIAERDHLSLKVERLETRIGELEGEVGSLRVSYEDTCTRKSCGRRTRAPEGTPA